MTGWFGGRSVAALVDRARRKLAAGKLDDAARIVEGGLRHFPDSSGLLDLRLTLRRARAHKTMRRLEARIEMSADPIAYEELVKLYLELELPEEARRKAEAYAQAHPTRDTPHLMLGEMLLELFLTEMQARHGHRAHDHLLRAANLNSMALQPRLLLAELYFCIDARHSLATMNETLQRMAPETSAMEAAFAAMDEVADAGAHERLEGLFERIEFEGRLCRDPLDWPLSKRRANSSELREDAADEVVQELIAQGHVDEVVLLRRDGSLVTHATPLGLGGKARGAAQGESPDGAEAYDEMAGTLLGAPVERPANEGFVGVVRTVSGKVFPQAREFDMGKFSRCTIRSAHGNVVVGRIGHVVVGLRAPSSREPSRTWERLAHALESVTGRVAS